MLRLMLQMGLLAICSSLLAVEIALDEETVRQEQEFLRNKLDYEIQAKKTQSDLQEAVRQEQKRIDQRLQDQRLENARIESQIQDRRLQDRRIQNRIDDARRGR